MQYLSEAVVVSSALPGRRRRPSSLRKKYKYIPSVCCSTKFFLFYIVKKTSLK
jgi:hypothetical protein